jgi:hypothetical protein
MRPQMRDMECPPDGVLSGYNTEILTVDHKGLLVPRSLRVNF